MKILYSSVFEGAEDYARARIPGIVCLDDGSIIAYCELRRTSDDWAVIDVGMRKSTDNGKTWGERRILVSGEGENTVNNPLMIADGDTVHFLYCLNYRRVFYMKSTDGGDTWSETKELTNTVKEQTKGFFWSCIAVGPTHGIKTREGRLVVPVWLAYNKEDPKSHHPSVICVLYSDDGGNNWNVGKVFDGLADPSEFSAVQLPDGRLIANIRHENGEKYRAVGEITSFAEIVNVHFDDALPDPVCCAGTCAAGEYILFSNCADKEHRIALTLRKLDNTLTVKDSLLLSEEAGYSDIAVNGEFNNAYILYECGKTLICVTVEI